MANFGKKAKLESQKSTVKVECIVSVYDTTYDDDGKPVRYKVIVQRLQDNVTREEAMAGLADALPYITNKKQWYIDEMGNNRAIYSHYDYVLPDMMDAIKKAAENCYKTVVKIEDADLMISEKEIENYCVKLDIGFNLAKREAFFYRIKSNLDVNKESFEKDMKYNMRHMPVSGRKLTKDIIDKHREITDIALSVYQKSLEIGSDHENIQK